MLLDRLAAYGGRTSGPVLGPCNVDACLSALDPKTDGLVRIGALVAAGADVPEYTSVVGAALAAGVTADEVLGAVIAVAPIVGSAPVVSATPALGLAIGYDIDAALE
jgi:alkylhydroperoxidase/carboxymuconolactone decarboxylase family protein YurZ